jgi:hypothetical protein
MKIGSVVGKMKRGGETMNYYTTGLFLCHISPPPTTAVNSEA